MGSGDDVGQEAVLDLGDAVLEDKFLLLEALDHQRIACPAVLEGANGGVEVAMLALEHFEFYPKHLFALHLAGNGSVHDWAILRRAPRLSKRKTPCFVHNRLPYSKGVAGSGHELDSRFEKGMSMTKLTLGTHPFLLGFDQLERLVERTAKEANGYPPYNIEQIGDDAFRITLAVAGFRRDELAITLENRQLTVRGRQGDEEDGRVFLHRGIAARQFQRSFVLADGVEVKAAEMENGLLHIDVARIRPESVVETIEIKTG